MLKKSLPMRWDQDHESPDLIDRRGEGGAGPNVGGLLWLIPWLLRTPFGWVVLLVVLGVAIFQGVRRGLYSGNAQNPGGGSNVTDPQAHFVAFVLDDVQSSWESQLARRGSPYRHAKLVLFADSTRTACGYGDAATGPFYCPNDERVYIDLGFYRELEGRLGARGDFAKAYVVAHEIGHHVQKLLGTSDKAGTHDEGATGGSVRLELQADCYAGIWAHSTQQRNILESGDIQSALGAAAAIGDDRLQRRETGLVRPDSFTHGTSAQRVRWFTRGYETGSIQACDTFAARAL
jgi:predicted metalloprotease